MKIIFFALLVFASCTHRQDPPKPVPPPVAAPTSVVEEIKGRWATYSKDCKEQQVLTIYPESETQARMKDFDAYFESKDINELRRFEEKCKNVMTFQMKKGGESTAACITSSEKVGGGEGHGKYKLKFINPYVSPEERTLVLHRSKVIRFGQSEWLEAKNAAGGDFRKGCKIHKQKKKR